MASARANGNSEVVVEGIIKGQEDYNDIKRVVQELVDGGTNQIQVKITDSNSISSSVIGFFMKVVNKDQVSVHIDVKDDRLYKIFNDLNLVSVFNVKKAG